MHTIQAVADRTGLTPDVIRVWERRYAAITPMRTPTNQRNYSDDDIERLSLFRKLTEQGLRISNIAALSTPELLVLWQKEMRNLAIVTPEPTSIDAAAEATIEEGLVSITDMDSLHFESVLQRAVNAMGTVSFLTRFVTPLVEQVGDLWRAGTLRAAQEHFCSAYLQSFLGRMRVEANPTAAGPVIVVATPPGHLHDLGALMVAIVAAQGGWQPLYLGASMPAEELLFAVQRKSARALAVSMTYPPDDERIPGYISHLRQQLPGDVPLLLGGASMSVYAKKISLQNVYLPESLDAYHALLPALRR